MKRLHTLWAFFLILGMVFLPTLSQAYNSATHIYIADRIFPHSLDKINLHYGAIAPDIYLYANPTKWQNGFCETHYKFIKLPYIWWNLSQKAFAQGWQIHNEIWGIDYYAHGTCLSCSDLNTCQYNGYVPTHADSLSENFPLLKNYPDLAHFAIEVAIDLLLVNEKDLTLGKKLLNASLFRSPSNFNLLI